MPKPKRKPLPPDGWLIRGEISSSGLSCVEIVPPLRDEILNVLTTTSAREFADAIIRECDYLEGKT